jgi:DNA-binding IclR family transcriptional regulator
MSQTIKRGFAVLSGIAARRTDVTFSTLPELFPDIAPATLARTVKYLLKEGYLEKRADGTYSLGPEAVGFARSILGASIPRDQLVRPAVERLAEDSGESAAYYEMDGDALLVVAKKDMPQSFHHLSEGSRPGRLQDHLFSQAIAAFSGRESAGKIAQIENLSKKGRTELEKRLREIFDKGVADGPENANVAISRVVCPVFGVGANPVGAIGLTVLNPGIPDKRNKELIQKVKETAENLSAVFENNNL